MPLKSAYDMDHFEPGWSRIPQYKNAPDPRDISCWFNDPWPVLPPRQNPIEPSEKQDAKIIKFIAEAKGIPFRRRSILKSQVDNRLAHSLALDAPYPDLRLSWILARTYEAADCYAAQLTHEYCLIKKCKKLSRSLMKSLDGHSWNSESITPLPPLFAEQCIKTLNELIFLPEHIDLLELRDCLEARADKRVELAKRFLEIRQARSKSGRKSDLTFRFFVQRLIEVLAVSTELPLGWSFKPSSNRHGKVIKQWQQILSSATSAAGLPEGEHRLDHVLRVNKKTDTVPYLTTQLRGLIHSLEKMPMKKLNFGILPSVGLQIDLSCTAFYKQGEYPPSHRAFLG